MDRRTKNKNDGSQSNFFMKDHPRIIFMGTTDFAVASLKKILEHLYPVIGVVTTPDKPAGRGQKITESAIKKFASIQGLPLLQPENLKDPIFLTALREWPADIQIVVAFRLLPKEVWASPTLLGSFNLHASLLPQYRGAAPIHWAVINGETETGLTTFLLNEQIDRGKILLQRKISIGPQETMGEVYNRLMETGADLVIETLEGLTKNTLHPLPQPSRNSLKTAPKISREDCRIDWTAPLNTIFNKIRGLSPHPAAWTLLSSRSGASIPFKIYRSKPIKQKNDNPIKKIIITASQMKVSVTDGYLSIIEGQLSGKRQMYVNDLINGIDKKNLLSVE
ncbi:MAG: methionyl-tRNA formyltransferase [Flavobacteriales bacterium Tduv]